MFMAVKENDDEKGDKNTIHNDNFADENGVIMEFPESDKQQ